MSTREAPQRSGRTKARVEPERVTEQETALRRLQARGERLLQWFPELRKTWQRDAEPSIEALVGQLQSLGGSVSRRAQETGRDLEARAERILADLERQALRGIGPLLSRANLATGSELSDVENRLARLEERLEPLAAERAADAARVERIERRLDEARADADERARELAVRLSASDELRADLANLHAHVDALSREQVTRSLEIGKLHDRLVRLEMRMGDVVKEQGTQVAAQQDLTGKLVEMDRTITEASRGVQALRDGASSGVAELRATEGRLAALTAARNGDHDELGRLADLLATVQQTLRQIDLRLGDLGERSTGVREELAGLAARVSHLELASTRAVSSAMLGERTEGH
jgi:chromosome segregation ATPase